jgi:hypothetical protein
MVPNADQKNSDSDSRGDACDNCPKYSDPSQSDVNNDGVGDACDCYDVFKGPHETGVDCGGVCGPCIDCTWCGSTVTPVRIKGTPNSGQIDVVFVPHENFQNNISQFNTQVINTIRNAYFTMDDLSVDPLPSNYKDRFNFYSYTGGFGTKYGCDRQLPGEDNHDDWAKWCIPMCTLVPFGLGCACFSSEPTTFWNDVPFVDSAGILSATPTGGCAKGLGPPSKWIADAGDMDESIHESAHSILGLSDEYCGDTSYNRADPFPNIWESLNDCQNVATSEKWTLGTCRRIEGDTDPAKPGMECQKDYWRYDPDAPDEDVMTCNCATYRFYEADLRRVNYVFKNWPIGRTKGVLLYFNINNDVITLLSSKVVGSHPDLGMQYAHFIGEALSSSGELLKSFGIWDPRIELEDTTVIKNNVNFHVIIPFYDDVKTFRINDANTGEVLVTVDLTGTLSSYCAGTNYESDECQTVLDLDNDGISGTDDNCPGLANTDQTDTDMDGVGDVCDNCPYMSNADQLNSDEDWQGDACDPEIQVPVDIKPQSCPNPINVTDRGDLTVAILGQKLDVSKINPSSLRLKGLAPKSYTLNDVSTPFEPYTGKTRNTDCITLGPDGKPDLVLKFDVQKVVKALGAVADRQIRILRLTGSLLDGKPIEGEDVVVILRKK